MLRCRQQDFSPWLLLRLGRPKAETADEKSLDHTVTFPGFEGLKLVKCFTFQIHYQTPRQRENQTCSSRNKNYTAAIPVPLETDKPVHDKQMAAICLPWHNPEERKREAPSCELDKIRQQDSNAGQPQKMS